MSLGASRREVSTAVLGAALAVPILAWTVHLTASSALATQLCAHSSLRWALHGITAATALVCIGCGLVGVAAWRRVRDEPGRGAVRFLGLLVAAVAVTNLVLILWEGSYTEFVPACQG
jgi:hypothetical protein